MNRPLLLRPVSELTVRTAEPLDVGPVPEGYRRIIPICGGRAEGPLITGDVISGGADWNLRRSDGSTQVWARYALRTDDGVVLTITNSGTFVTVDGRRAAITALTIEAPMGKY